MVAFLFGWTLRQFMFAGLNLHLNVGQLPFLLITVAYLLYCIMCTMTACNIKFRWQGKDMKNYINCTFKIATDRHTVLYTYCLQCVQH